MKVKDVMTTAVRHVGEGATLKEAAALMAELRISGLPVVGSDGRVVGVISEGDILFKETGPAPKAGLVVRLFSLPAPELAAKLEAKTVGEAMTSPAVKIGPDRPVTEAASLMLDENVKRLPVVDDSAKLVGIVSRADLVRAFVRSDEEIEREIREEVLRRALWIDPVLVRVIVERGEVRLEGTVENQSEAELLPRLVQRVPGVVSVLSKLRWLDENGDRGGSRGQKAVWQRR
jgi:CBS domain-containing protein